MKFVCAALLAGLVFMLSSIDAISSSSSFSPPRQSTFWLDTAVIVGGLALFLSAVFFSFLSRAMTAAKTAGNWKKLYRLTRFRLHFPPRRQTHVFLFSIAALSLARSADPARQAALHGAVKAALGTVRGKAQAREEQKELSTLVLRLWHKTHDADILDLWDRVEKLYHEQIDAEPRNAAVWFDWGWCIAQRTMEEPAPHERRRLWEAVCAKLEKASASTSDSPFGRPFGGAIDAALWQNWGVALIHCAEAEADPTVRRQLYAAAEEKFRTAFASSFDDRQNQNDWEWILTKRLEQEEDAVLCHRLSTQIEEIYRHQVAAGQDDPLLWINWGWILSKRLVHETEHTARRLLYTAMEEKYERALSIEPTNETALEGVTWTLDKRLEEEKDSAAQRVLLDKMLRKHRQRTEAEPHSVKAWSQRGHLLIVSSLRDDCTAPHSTWLEARGVLDRALALDAKNATLWNSQGQVLYLLAEIAADTDERRRLWDEAEASFRAADAIEPDTPDTLDGLALIRFMRGFVMTHKTDRARRHTLWQEAIALHQKAIDHAAERNDAQTFSYLWVNHGYMLGYLAAASPANERAALWERGEAACAHGVADDPPHLLGWINWARLLFDRAQAATNTDERHRLIRLMEEKLDEAERQKKNSTLTMRAAIACRNGERTACLDFLDRAVQTRNFLTTRSLLLAYDEVFAPLWDDLAFKDIIATLRRQERAEETDSSRQRY